MSRLLSREGGGRFREIPLDCFVSNYCVIGFYRGQPINLCSLLALLQSLSIPVHPQMVENIGVEPIASCLQSRRSTK